METRSRTKPLQKQNKLTLIDQPMKAPEDIVNLDEQLGTTLMPDKKYTLYDYFSQKDGSSIIKSWSKLLNKKETNKEIQAYQELLSLILQISGCRIDMKNIQIESDSFDSILDEFRKKVEKNKQIPSLYRLLKNKSNKILTFWKEISESLITNNSFTSESYKHFIEWIIAFNCCKIRVIRLSTTFLVCSLFECLASSISWRNEEIQKFQQKTKSKKQSNDQIVLFEKEISLYTSIANDLYKKLIIVRVRDIDDQIRNLSIKSLTNVIIKCDICFFDEQKLKYIGRALNDTSAINRMNALICYEKIIMHVNGNEDTIQTENIEENDYFNYSQKESHEESRTIFLSPYNDDEQNNDLNQINRALIEFSEMYSPRIIEMCNDSDEEVVAEAIKCIGVLIDSQLINPNDCQNIKNLISDNSQIIRKAAADFIAKREFFDNENSDNLDHFLTFIRNFNVKKDIHFIVLSLYPYLKCLKKWDEMCNRLISEENDDRSKIISAILLHSAKIAINQAENYSQNNATKAKNSQDNQNIEKVIKKARKLTFVLIQNLPQLLKAYQSSKNKEIIQNLVETSSFLDLNAISENSFEKQYEKLLNQLHEIFIKFNQGNDENIKLFKAAFNSIYILSKNRNQLSEIAQKELDKLSMIFSDFGSSEKDDDSNENINSLLTKFAVAARIVDISDNKKLKEKIIFHLNQKLKKYVVFSQSETDSSSESDQDDEDENDELLISNSIECLHYYFKWDVKKIHDFLINRKVIDGESDEIAEKIDKLKEPYISEFHEFTNIFSKFLKSKKSTFKIKLSAFKALGSNISLLPILTHETASGLSLPYITSPIIANDISDAFYEFYHDIESIKLKSELFEIAELPIIVKTIDIGYSAHLLIYNHITFPPKDNESKSKDSENDSDSKYVNEMTEKVKKLWRNISQFQPINGKQLYSAISHIVERFPIIKSADLRRVSRFFVGKFKVFDFIKEWAEDNDEDEQFFPVVVTFLFGLNESEANQLRGLLSDRFEDVLDKISNGTKLTTKDIIKLQVDRKSAKKRKSTKSETQKEARKSSSKKEDRDRHNQSSSDSDNKNESDDDVDEIEVVESSDDDKDDDQAVVVNNDSLNYDDDDDDVNQVVANDDDEDEESSDVQEINPNDDYDCENQYSQESEVEFQEPDETFVFK